VASKYDPLKQYLIECGPGPITMAFFEVEDVLGFPLPKAARAYDAWWLDTSSGTSHAHAFAWLAANRHVERVDRAAATVAFTAFYARF
jgi:hypothetical protein